MYRDISRFYEHVILFRTLLMSIDLYGVTADNKINLLPVYNPAMPEGYPEFFEDLVEHPFRLRAVFEVSHY